jgi:hypothetical protein
MQALLREPQSYADRRRHKRKQVLWAAIIGKGDLTRSCVILDFSASGAKARIPHSRFQPRDSVTLLCPRIGCAAAEIVWQQENLAGLRFTSPPGSG